MQNVVSFYEKLPRGVPAEVKPKGLFGRYQARYFGKNPSAARMCPGFNTDENMLIYGFTAIVHVIVGLIAIGYAQNYYFHLRELARVLRLKELANGFQVTTRTTLTRCIFDDAWGV
jgi:hypothetical protein